MKTAPMASLLAVFAALPLFAQTPTQQSVGQLKPPSGTEKPMPVRNQTARPRDEIVTLRYFRIKKGTFDEFYRLSAQEIWPYFEKIGARSIGMWKVFEPAEVEGVSRTVKDYDEAWMATRYASVEHWKATREDWKLGGNGPDWELCRHGLDARNKITISSTVVFLKGHMAEGGPYFMPGLAESSAKK